MSKRKKLPVKAPNASKAPVVAGVVFGVFIVVAVIWIWKGGHVYGPSNAAAATSPSAPVATTAPSGGSSATSKAPFTGTAYTPQGHAHLAPDEPDDFVYNSNPPTSGPHKELFSDQFVNPNPLPPYIQVHLLEHGNVLLQYNCTCPDVAASLSAVAFEYDSKLIAPNELQPTPQEVQAGEEQGRAVIVAPNPKMKSRIALTAWTRLATLSAVDKPKIDSFIGYYLANSANASQ